MTFLWNSKEHWKSNINSGNPSPTNERYIKDFAQNLFCSIKRLSLFTVFQNNLMAGMTVEAAVVLPVFLLFFLNLASLIEMMRLHNNLQFALWETGNKTTVYTCAAESEETDSLLSVFYIKNQMIVTLGREYLEQSPLMNGMAEIKVVTNSSTSEDDVLDVTVSYRVAPLSGLIGFPSFRMSNCYYAHLWNGYEIPETSEENQIVYVTENGTVYHPDRNCTHLTLSIEKAEAADIETMRNQWGRKYGPCERCARGERPENIFITREGECYHYSAECAGLKRTVYAMPLAEIQGRYQCCSRCGKERGGY